MKKLVFFLVILLLSAGSSFAQNKPKTTKVTKAKAPKKEEVAAPPAPKYVKMPNSTSDCNTAFELFGDTVMNLLAPPKGPGFLVEVKRDAQNPHLFETEHNVIWYKIRAPYTSKLLVNITPLDSTDNYDFLLYEGNDPYFCNKVLNKKVKPLISNLSTARGITGISLAGKSRIIAPSSKEAYAQAVDVKKGEIYYLVLDNPTHNPGPYNFQLQFHVSGVKPLLRILDGKTNKPLGADILITEESGDKSVTVDKRDTKSTYVVFENKTDYSMYVKKDGYFSYKEYFNASKYLEDSTITIRLHPIVVGAKYAIKDIYFEDGLTELLPDSKPALMVIVDMLNEHPNLRINIQGFINTDGYNVDEDMKVTVGRSVSVRKFFEGQGIAPDRMTNEGMTKKDLSERAEYAITGNNSKLLDKKIEITITKIDEIQ